MLRIPIVQGEYDEAHLNRLVGTLDIGGQALTESLPANSVIEVTVEVDRGGRLSARALVPRLGQVFESVAQLVVPDATPEQLDKLVAELRARLNKCRTDADRARLVEVTAALYDVDWALSDVERDISAARGGDADAGQKARRTVLELDAKLDEAESQLRWPELDDQAKSAITYAARWTGRHGTPTEKKLLAESQAALDRARASKQPTELQRQIRLVRELGWASMTRDYGAWEGMFERAASNYGGATDLRRADELVRQGRQIVQDPGDEDTKRDRLRRVTEDLWRLLPSDAESRRLGFDSGVR
jgi:molecular chaperone DnaK